MYIELCRYGSSRDKFYEKNDEWEGSRGERAVLERVVKEGLSKEITFKQRPE